LQALYEKECAMRNKDEVKGTIKQIKGRTKQEIGVRRGDPDLVDEGSGDRAAGEVQEGYGKARRKVGEAVERLGRKVKR
jgi:uncharacterized protein YjbJ (UPF0337 family)